MTEQLHICRQKFLAKTRVSCKVKIFLSFQDFLDFPRISWHQMWSYLKIFLRLFPAVEEIETTWRKKYTQLVTARHHFLLDLNHQFLWYDASRIFNSAFVYHFPQKSTLEMTSISQVENFFSFSWTVTFYNFSPICGAIGLSSVILFFWKVSKK